MSLPMTSLQAIQERKEQMKLQFKRDANQLRNQRFLNARQRVIGVDIAALDAQVLEKKLAHEDNQELLRLEKLKCLELDRIMEAAADEEARMQKFYNDQMKKSWEDSISKKRVDDTPDYVPEKFTSSSFQKFSGEDENREARLRQQKMQMKNWVQEQVAEKAFKNYQDKEQQMQYADLLRQIDAVREESENEEAQMRKMILKKTLQENDLCIQEKRKIKEDEKFEHLNSKMGLFMNLDEDQAVAMDEYGRIVRKDMFKGFTEGQRRKILLENEELLRIKHERDEEERSYERDWAMQQYMSSRAMEEAYLEETYLRNREKEKHLDILERQKREQDEARRNRDRDRFGSIGNGFFSNFGKSCR